MTKHFANITYTPTVRAMQRRYNAKELSSGAGSDIAELGQREQEYIAARDSFFLATISETGWPHVQHRGGPAGFVKVIDRNTLAYADYRGNRQYVSVGNLTANDRAAMILMDYPNRRRLKIMGRIEVHDIASAPVALRQALAVDDDPKVERIMVIHVAAFDWNCSQHITPRYSKAELATYGFDRTHSDLPTHAKENHMKLYDLALSGNCYKVRLLAALANIPLEIVPVDFLGGEHKRSPLINLNPFGQIPIIEDGDVVLRDSQAILIYLAAKYAGENWLPKDPAGMATVMQWLSTSANEIQNGPGAARLVDKFGYDIDKADTLKRSARILPLLDAHLTSHRWLALERPTIADCAVFPYVALALEGGISLEPYPHIRFWIGRIKELPGFIPMPGIQA